MFKNILVPTDFTKKSVTALDIALRIGSKDGFKITLLHVIEILEGTDETEFREFYDRLEDRAEKKMEEMVNQYEKDNPNIDTAIVLGNRVREIVRYAQDNDTDLIVLSSHRIENLDASEGWATISYKVGILSPCPVMMVK